MSQAGFLKDSEGSTGATLELKLRMCIRQDKIKNQTTLFETPTMPYTILNSLSRTIIVVITVAVIIVIVIIIEVIIIIIIIIPAPCVPLEASMQDERRPRAETVLWSGSG